MYNAGCNAITEYEMRAEPGKGAVLFCRKQMRSKLHFATIEKCIRKSERLIKQEIEAQEVFAK